MWINKVINKVVNPSTKNTHKEIKFYNFIIDVFLKLKYIQRTSFPLDKKFILWCYINNLYTCLEEGSFIKMLMVK